jgi:hypothetical protein
MAEKEVDIASLLVKKVKNELTHEEENIITGWIEKSIENQRVFDELTNEDSLQLAMKELYEFQRIVDLVKPKSIKWKNLSTS